MVATGWKIRAENSSHDGIHTLTIVLGRIKLFHHSGGMIVFSTLYILGKCQGNAMTDLADYRIGNPGNHRMKKVRNDFAFQTFGGS
jgi:hypothetical protein